MAVAQAIWKPERSGDWSADNATGRTMAIEAVSRMRQDGNPVMLGHLVKQMIEGGVYDGVETGFFHALSVEILKR